MKCLFLFLFLAGSIIVSPSQTPVIRARLIPAKGIIVGQPIHLTVEVLVPNFFTGSPSFPTFELKNAIVVLSEDTPANTNEQINGQIYAGIRQTYFIYPQQAGDFQLPPVRLTIPYARVPPKTTQALLTLPQLAFHAEIPAAAAGLSYFLPTTKLTMQQRWDSPLENLRVGDTIERTITITATRMQGMLIPPLPLEASSGIRIYPGEPKVQDQKTDRGEFISGSRTEFTKYFIQKEGDYTLPAIELKWWSLSSNKLVTTAIPAVHFTAASNPGYVEELPPEREITAKTQPKPSSLWSRYRGILITAPILLSAFVILWLAYRYLYRLGRFLKKRYQRHLHSESAYFNNLIRSCRRNHPQETYQWLLNWLEISGSKRTLNYFLEEIEDEQLTQQINALAETLFTKTPLKTWDGAIMASRLRKHRKLDSSQQRQRIQLPSLNP
jgi:hypothetical protein